MKKFIYFILLYPVILFSQNYEPLQQTFDIDTGNGKQTMYISADLPFFQQQKPFYSWYWSDGASIVESLPSL